MIKIKDLKPEVSGLGDVGLALAVEMAKHYQVVGCDLNDLRVEQLNNGDDTTKEITPDELKNAEHLKITSDLGLLNLCNIYIVTVPTPIDASKAPNLQPLLSASDFEGRGLNAGVVVVFESTGYLSLITI